MTPPYRILLHTCSRPRGISPRYRRPVVSSILSLNLDPALAQRAMRHKRPMSILCTVPFLSHWTRSDMMLPVLGCPTLRESRSRDHRHSSPTRTLLRDQDHVPARPDPHVPQRDALQRREHSSLPVRERKQPRASLRRAGSVSKPYIPLRSTSLFLCSPPRYRVASEFFITPGMQYSK